MKERKKKRGRVKLGSLPRREKELSSDQAGTIKGGAGNAGAGGGDVRSLVQTENQ